jgi:hypothetical protein
VVVLEPALDAVAAVERAAVDDELDAAQAPAAGRAVGRLLDLHARDVADLQPGEDSCVDRHAVVVAVAALEVVVQRLVQGEAPGR